MKPIMYRNLQGGVIPKQVARLNFIAGTPKTAFKFGPKYTKMEIFLINQTPQKASVGLKQFWRQHLPTLKFHNEDFQFIMKRITVENKADAAKVPVRIDLYDAEDKKIQLDCSFKSELDILQEVLSKTEATPVATEDIPKITLKKAKASAWQ